MADPAVSTFPQEIVEDAESERERQAREEEQFEEERFEREIAKKLEGGFDDIELDLEEDDEEEGGNGHPMKTPQNAGGGSRLPEHFLTSTPYLRPGEAEGERHFDTPPQDRSEDAGTPTNDDFRNQRANQNEQREILYMARGHEIERLKAEIDGLRNENGGENRRIQHELALLRAENGKLNVQMEQTNEAHDSAMEENRHLRQEISNLKATLQKHEKNREDLISRAESSDNLVQTLQHQLIDFQRKDTVLKAREHHDATVRSLKERHESEMFSLQQEIDRQAAVIKRLDSENENIRGRMNETQRHHETMLIEKSERIEDLNMKLAATQKRLTELIVTNSADDVERRIGDPVKEICDLKATLVSVTQQRNEQKKQLQDLMDENLGLQRQISDGRTRADSATAAQKEAYELRKELARKDRILEELQNRERDLLEKHEKLRSDMLRIRENIENNAAGDERNRRHLEQHQGREVQMLKDELSRKDEALVSQESRIKDIIAQWEEETERIRSNHGKDSKDLAAIQNKYNDLKKKVRQYQRHVKNKEAHYLGEIERLQDVFGGILKGYKSKVDTAYHSKEKLVEDELYELKRNFDAEIKRLANQYEAREEDEKVLDNPDDLVSARSESKTTSSKRKQRSRSNSKRPQGSEGSSDEENHRAKSRGQGSLSRSGELARIFAAATKDVRHELKRPPTNSNILDQYLASPNSRTPLTSQN